MKLFAPRPDQPRRDPRQRRGRIAAIITVVGLGLFIVVPMPYVVLSPGTVDDVLGTTKVEKADVPLISISGATTYPTTGKLLLTTVGITGSPRQPLAMGQVVVGWLTKSETVMPSELYYPPDVKQDEVDAANAADMTESQQTATVAALTELGHEVPVTLTIQGAAARSSTGTSATDTTKLAVDVVKKGDVITSLNGRAVTSYAAFLKQVSELTAGSEVSLGVKRDGKDTTLRFATYAYTASDETTSTRLGLELSPDYKPSISVDIQIGEIGGPSAGTMFALGIIDKLTPGSLTGGKTVAGTGTIDAEGTVGAIGGIEHKMLGAREAGATLFLAPASNCADVAGNVPDGLTVVAVDTLHEARQAVEAMAAGSLSGLNTCGADGKVVAIP